MRFPRLVPNASELESIRSRASWLALLFAVLGSAWVCSPRLTMEQFELPKHAAILAALAFAAVMAPSRLRPGSFPSLPALAGLLAILAVATASSSSPLCSFLGSSESLAGLLTWLTFIALFLHGTSLDRGRTRALSRLIVITAAGSAVYALVQQRGWDPFPGESFRHVRAFAGNPDFLAQQMAIALPFFLAPPLRNGRAGGWAGVALITLALGLTASRAGLVGAMAGAGVLIWLILPTRIRIARLFSAGLALIASLGAAEFLLDPGLAIRTRALALSGDDGIERARGLVWRGCAGAVLARPLTGHGPDTLGAVFPHFAPLRWASRAGLDTSPRNAHSEPLHLLAIGGVPLMGVWLWLLTCVARACAARKDPQDAPVAAALAACLTHNFFAFSTAATAPLFWLLLGRLGRGCPGQPAVGRFSSAALGLGLALASLGAVRLAAGAYAFIGNEGDRHASARLELAGFGAASRLAPWETTYLVRYGRALEKGGRQEEAVAAYRASVALAPANGLYLGNLGRACYALAGKEADEVERVRAFRMMLGAVELAPCWPSLYSAAIQAARELGLEEEERKLLERLRVTEPGWANAIEGIPRRRVSSP